MNHGCSPYKRNARAIRVFDRNPNWCANRRYRDHIMVLKRRLKRTFGSLVEQLPLQRAEIKRDATEAFSIV